ncbi:MAG: F0F1 ATP synthase subunit B [Planctomycetota bacterium]|nr:F0F1 ATP synthase subunit B [Planctomycetota bacterium]
MNLHKTPFAAALLVLVTASSAFAQEGHEEPSLFAGTIYQSIAAILVFLILLAVLKKHAWGPIIKGLSDREGKIREDLEQAERAYKQAATTLEEYRKQLSAAHDEARKIIDQSRADAQRIATQIKDQTQAEINAMRVRAQAEIKQSKEQALSEIYTQTANLATDVASRILRKEINAADQRRLVEDSLAAAAARSN